MRTIFYFAFVLLFATSSYAQDILGTWTGELSIQGYNLKLNFNIEKKGGEYKSTMDSPSQGAFGIPASKTVFVDSELTVEISSAGISYNGTLVDANNIKGKFSQAGQSFDLSLKKSSAKDAGPKRPQEPQKPYPYNSTEISFRNEKDDITLKGTLTTPKEGEDFPAVVLVTGSGPQNRDEELFGHKPFLVISDFLTKAGVAVLRYDERGVGESEGDYEKATPQILATDTEAAIEFLRNQDNIDEDKIGIIGHSEGGVIAPGVASKDDDLAFIVMLAGPVISGKDLLLLQKYKLDSAAGAPKSVLDKNNEIFGAAHDIVRDRSLNGKELEEALNKHFEKSYGDALPKKQRDEIVRQFTTVSMREIICIKPYEYIKEVEIPMLALFGSKDLQVPATENIALLRELKKEHDLDVEIKEFANLNHLFQECETGMIQEYGKIEQTIAPQVLNYIKDWILKQ